MKEYYHIFVDNGMEEKRGKASSIDELFKLFTHTEIKKIFDYDAFNYVKDLFKTKKLSQDSFILNVNGLSINLISNGSEITTLVFYL